MSVLSTWQPLPHAAPPRSPADCALRPVPHTRNRPCLVVPLTHQLALPGFSHTWHSSTRHRPSSPCSCCVLYTPNRLSCTKHLTLTLTLSTQLADSAWSLAHPVEMDTVVAVDIAVNVMTFLTLFIPESLETDWIQTFTHLLQCYSWNFYSMSFLVK